MMNPTEILELLKTMLSASLQTIGLFACTMLFAVPIGVLVLFMRTSKNAFVRGIAKFYLLIMRGTPLMLQLVFVYFAPYYILGLSYDRFLAAVIAFSLNYAAYFAEIYRGGLSSIPAGQYEAATALGFKKGQTFGKIILPQVVKRILPPMCSETMTLVKDTALAQTIAVMELFRAAQNSVTRSGSVLPLLIAGVFYLVMNGIVSKAYAIGEKKLAYYE